MKWSAGLELQNESCKFRNFYRTLWFGVNFRLDAILWKFEAEIPGSTFFDYESDSESMISFASIPVPIPSLK